MVVPLRAGGGTRLKIFEAMAAKAAVVSTTVGAEGLAVAAGKDLLLADDARQFADAVIGVLRSNSLRNSLTESASATVQRFDWAAVATGFCKTLTQIVERRGRA